MVPCLRTTFIFLIHFHQPLGQLKQVLERIQANCYEPLVELLKTYKHVKVAVHFSGLLLRMWSSMYPDFLDSVRELAHMSNVEVLGGTYSEAALPLIPLEDRVEQLKRGRKLVEDALGVRPRGAWLPERVWDPTLPPALESAGYEYVVVDDEVGFRAGLGEHGVHRAWLVEYSGSKVGVFFIDARIRYLLPWKSHREVLDYLATYKTHDGAAYVMWGSDAEKFGEWWDRREAEKWLRGFFSLLEQEEWVETETPLRYLRKHGYAGLAYLPPGSYDKMMEWSGGYFPLFLTKYRESDNMHKKMLYVREKLAREAPPEAWESYYLAQCNDAYWHGLFGGVYLPILRQAVYEHLIRAERLAEKRPRDHVTIAERDFDFDGESEVILESGTLSAYVKPGDGGTVFELDVRIPGFEHNLVNTMSRYPEPYLDSGRFRPDWYRRVCFREHIWRKHGDLDDWISNTPFFDVSDLALARYFYSIDENRLRLHVTGRDWSDRERPRRIYVEKTFEINPAEPVFEASYYWRLLEREEREYRLCVELTLAPRLPYDGGNVWYEVEGCKRSIDKPYVAKEACEVRLCSEGYPDVVVESSEPAEIWVAPVMSLSRTERGLREIYQCLGVALNFGAVLSSDSPFQHRIILRLEEV